MFALLKCWCVHGAKHICVGAVGAKDFWVVFFSVDVNVSAVVPNVFSNLCNAFPWILWKV